MWTRTELKERAKNVLRLSYWKAFVISIVLAMVGGSGSVGVRWNTGTNDFEKFKNGFNLSSGELAVILAIIGGIIFIAMLIGIAIWIFVGAPVEVGGARYFVQAAQNQSNMDNLGFAFKKDRYFSTIKAMLWRALFTFLWTLLFVIPGIVKSYAYRMVPYILSDNPTIGYQKALILSMKMTQGQKWKIFVLDLSFIGWGILGVLACCIGSLFLMPYINSTRAELYISLRGSAFASGICTPEELMIPETAPIQSGI